MRELSSTFRQAVYNGDRNYQCRAEITLLDDTELEITNANIMLGGIEIFDSVTSDNSFDALGSVIINAISITLDNSSDTYSQYDFYGASVVFYMGLEDIEEICIGTYSIDDTSYNNATIVLYCLDNMVKFDKPYSDSSLTYPATLYTIVADICTVCGVTLDSDYSQFPHYNYTISIRPDDIALTCREVLSFVVSMCGCFAKCNSDGELQIKWFNTSELTIAGIDGGIFDSSTPYATGDSVNGGTMSPWSTGDIADGGTFTDVNGLHYISALASQTIATDDVTITGVKITIQNQVVDADSADEPIIDYLSGTADYTVSISNNPFLTADNAQTVANWLATDLVGLTFRPLSITHLDDLSIEAGDVALVLDRKGNVYKTLITNVLFKINSYETSKCSAESIPKKAGTRYSVEEKNYAITKVLVEKASTTATRYITDITNGIFVAPEGQGPNDTQTPTGWRIKDALELIKSGVTYIKMWLDNSVPKVQIGVANALNVLIDSADIKLRNSTTNLASFGASSITLGNDTNTKITLDTTNGLKLGNKIALDTSGNASFSGAITATSGRIGGFYITSTSNTGTTGNGGHCFTNSLYVHTSDSTYEYESGLKGDLGGAGNIIYYIKRLASGGSWSDASYVYYVANNGKLYASNAEIVGKVTATSGTIGGWTIGANSLSGAADNKGTGFQIPSSGTWAIAVAYDTTTPSSGWSTAPFRVKHNGEMWATNAHITGTITGSAGEFTQSFKVNTTYGPYMIGTQIVAKRKAYFTIKGEDVSSADKTNGITIGTEIYETGSDKEYININRGIKIYSPNHTFDIHADTVVYGVLEAVGITDSIGSYSAIFKKTVLCDSALGTGGKTAWNDTIMSGCWLTSGGEIHLTRSASSGGLIGFHYNFSANATTNLYENASGVLTCSGQFLSKSYGDSTLRPPVNSAVTSGKQIAYLACNTASQLAINGQWGNTSFGTMYASVSSSDIRLKKNVEDTEVESALDIINQIKLHSFDWLHTDEHQKIGFIADELEQIDPKLSMGGGTEKDGTINYKSVDTFYMMGYLVKAIQEQQKQIQQLQAEIAELKKGGTQ